jgi:hypothetical protein
MLGLTMRDRLTTLAAAATAVAAIAAPPAAAEPIPERPPVIPPPEFIGERAQANPISLGAAPTPPRHPFMAPNDSSNIHDDAYQTDSADRPGPLGREMERVSTFQEAECASLTFDRKGRVETVCVGVDRPTLVLMHPRTLDTLAEYELPEREPGGGSPTSDFSGGGYFYLDHRDRAVVVTNDRHLYVIAQRDGPEFERVRNYDLNPVLDSDDKLVAAMPDWSGLIHVVSKEGVVVTVDPSQRDGRIRSLDLQEPIGNSFAVDEDGGVYVVTDEALYRLDADRRGRPRVTWREEYENIGVTKPGQTQAGSGTTPTLMGSDHVAITDNDDPMNVVVYKRKANVNGERQVCEQPVFEQGASATDNSLIATKRSLVVENNFGYAGPQSTVGPGSTAPGLERVDLDRDGSGCSLTWHSDERAPSVVPKLSLRNGLVYTYTKDPDPTFEDPWYLTAIDFRSGETIYKRLAGRGLGFNNNYAPISIGPDGTAYVGVLGGLVALRDDRRPKYEKRPR